MSGENRGKISAEHELLGVKAWTAYVGTSLRNGTIILICLAWAATGSYFGLFGALIFGARLAYKVMVLKSYKLYKDRDGIWVYSGILPWSRGSSGVKWRDIDEAVYYTKLSSWLFRAYTVRIGHRFTRGAEIVFTHLGRGDRIVTEINGSHQEMVRANAMA